MAKQYSGFILSCIEISLKQDPDEVIENVSNATVLYADDKCIEYLKTSPPPPQKKIH